ncbi:hypothetical protein H6P81_003511 [Aristolochia fimbriata]|uniref:AB hydrolase-1 domain-containing protein n=1 Tax=Aristolochia fimbriata TaxID=158543 RepID=A0AAV7FH12_ARIFI|nr:hypothetical protein H6P81_003511 [Aristolochia fimbriata]
MMAILTKLALIAVPVVFLGWFYRSTRPPPPKLCGSPNGPPVTSKRIRLRDGRYLAYREDGVPKEKASYRIVCVHAFGDSKDSSPALNLKELAEELRIYFVSFDRAGYGESDPYPNRSVTSEAFDLEQLADELELGEKFYVVGASMGGCTAWACLKYIPHRLAGVALIVPVVNYWWPSLPPRVAEEGFRNHLVQDQWTLRVAHNAPSLLYWWMTQKWFPSLAALQGNPEVFSRRDHEVLEKIAQSQQQKEQTEYRATPTQQGVFESLHRDLITAFGNWDFEPMDVENPLPEGEGSVHLWQGCEDRFVPVVLQRYVAKKLPWTKYHEIPDGGHLVMLMDGMAETILRALLLGEESSDMSNLVEPSA